METRAALLLRRTSPDEDHSADDVVELDAQRERLTGYCVARGWRVTAEFRDLRQGSIDAGGGALRLLVEAARPNRSFDIVVASTSSPQRGDIFLRRKLQICGVRFTCASSASTSSAAELLDRISQMIEEYRRHADDHTP